MNIEYEKGIYKFRVNGSFISCCEEDLGKNIKRYGIKDFSIIIYETERKIIHRINKIAKDIRLENRLNKDEIRV